MKKDWIALGNELRRLRDQYGKTQEEAAGMGSLAYIANIEAGDRRPSDKKIREIAENCGFTYTETQYLRLLAGHIELSKMPSAAAILKHQKRIEEEMAAFSNPAYLADYRLTFWGFNRQAEAVLKSTTTLINILSRKMTSPQLLFDHQVELRQRIKNWEFVTLHTLRRFQLLNANLQHEPFFRAYPDCMEAKLTPQEYQEFREVWQKSIGSYNINNLSISARNVFELILPNGKICRFTIRINSLLGDDVFKDRFLFVEYQPEPESLADMEIRDYLDGFKPDNGRQCFMLWDYEADLDAFIQSYNEQK